jgi:hypothetical protein
MLGEELYIKPTTQFQISCERRRALLGQNGVVLCYLAAIICIGSDAQYKSH